MNKRAFTLIELIAVIIIMGLILLIVSPSLSRLLQSGDEKKYTEYYDLAVKASELYSREREADLGGVSHSGCVQNITVSDLVKKDYLKEFKEEDDVVCGSPSENFMLGIVDSENVCNRSNAEKNTSIVTGGYTDIRIDNNNGHIDVSLSLVCVDTKREEIVYCNLVKNTNSCTAYTPEVKSTLYEGIKKITTTTSDGDTKYITGSNPNNYVLYSGRLFRIISYNEQNRITKAILDDPITYLNFNVSSSVYAGSNVETFLNNVFLKSLRSPEIYLDDATFDNTSVTNTNKPASLSTFNSKVGLLSLYEYNIVKDYASISQSYFLSSRNGSNIWIAKPLKTYENVSVSTFSTIRPVIVFKGNVGYQTGGDGTKSNPYKVSGEKIASVGDNLNTRYVGEYVKFAGSNYRIIETNKDYTKLISTGLLNNLTSVYSTGSNVYSDYNVIGTKVSYEWYQNTLSEANRNKIYLNSYCTDSYSTSSKYTDVCSGSGNLNTNVALPTIGGMYSTSISSEYFTMTPSTSGNVYKIGSSVSSTPVTTTSGVRIVLSLKQDVKISGGSGTESSPYTLN